VAGGPPSIGDALTRLQGVAVAKAALDIAQGMIAEAGEVSFAHAARLLRSYAERRGTRLSEAADALVRGELGPAEVLGARDQKTS
jgi:hypothetical protein